MNEPTQPKPPRRVHPGVVAAAIALMDAETLSNEAAKAADEAVKRSRESIDAVNQARERLEGLAKDIAPGEGLMLPDHRVVFNFRGAGVFHVMRDVIVADTQEGS